MQFGFLNSTVQHTATIEPDDLVGLKLRAFGSMLLQIKGTAFSNSSALKIETRAGSCRRLFAKYRVLPQQLYGQSLLTTSLPRPIVGSANAHGHVNNRRRAWAFSTTRPSRSPAKAARLAERWRCSCAKEGAAVVVKDYGISTAGEGHSEAPADEVVRAINSAGGRAIIDAASVA